MKVRFRGFDNPVIIPASTPQCLIPPLGTFTVGRVYTSHWHDLYGAPHFHADDEDGFTPDIFVTDDDGNNMTSESMYWDLVEE